MTPFRVDGHPVTALMHEGKLTIDTRQGGDGPCISLGRHTGRTGVEAWVLYVRRAEGHEDVMVIMPDELGLKAVVKIGGRPATIELQASL